MLTAITKKGHTINLGFPFDKDSLLHLREQEEFICPVCGTEVLLKLGNQRIFHFAHRSDAACEVQFERETIYHLEGKLQLYQWLLSQGIHAELEFYDSEMKQRPDIMFYYNGVQYALEYQCSTLPEDLFIKRTQVYVEHGYIPLWIMGYKHVKEKRHELFELNHFDYYFLTKSQNGQYYIPTYCPEKMNFHLLSPIISYSAKNAFAHHIQFPHHSFTIHSLLEPEFNTKFNINSWYKEMDRFKMNCSLRPSPSQKKFLQEIYQHCLNLFLLPPEIGLPVRHSFLIQTPPVIWQTYLYIDVIQKLSKNDFIHLKDAERSLLKRMKKKQITLRNLPQLFPYSIETIVTEYFLQLEKVGVLVNKGSLHFQLQRNVFVPKTNKESEERKGEFYQKYKQILTKL
nr:competence protein CoiA family protein [Neobacillus sp. Marseille-Q6967]